MRVKRLGMCLVLGLGVIGGCGRGSKTESPVGNTDQSVTVASKRAPEVTTAAPKPTADAAKAAAEPAKTAPQPAADAAKVTAEPAKAAPQPAADTAKVTSEPVKAAPQLAPEIAKTAAEPAKAAPQSAVDAAKAAAEPAKTAPQPPTGAESAPGAVAKPAAVVPADPGPLPTERDRLLVGLQITVCRGALELYRLGTGSYPTTKQGLAALLSRPADLDAKTPWTGPYTAALPKDPWGRDYQYRFPAQRGNPDEPEIWSSGPDGLSGTADDIGTPNQTAGTVAPPTVTKAGAEAAPAVPEKAAAAPVATPAAAKQPASRAQPRGRSRRRGQRDAGNAFDRRDGRLYTYSIYGAGCMITRIQKWGNSLGLRIPKAVAEDAHVVAGARVDLKIDRGRIVISPAKKNRYRLRDMLEGITPENLHGEVSVGGIVGREVW